MSRIRKLWHDPVWSKVIAYGILFIAGAIGAYFSKSIGLFTDIANNKTTIPNWLIAVLFFLLFACCFAWLFLLFKFRNFPSEVYAGVSKDHSDGNSVKIYLKRQSIHWISYNDRIHARYWASGTSLIGVAERNLIQSFYAKGVRDIKVILPATERYKSSFNQLDQYDKLVTSQLVTNQVGAADKVYKKLLLCIKPLANGREQDFIRLYSGIMYANITIFDDDAFIALYDRTGIGDNSITIHFNKKINELGYQRVEEEFMNMWNADPDYGTIAKKKKGASILFFNSSNQILLFLRDNKEELAFPNKWDVLGGNVEEDESPEKCIKREMQEEIEIVLDNPKLFNVYDMNDRVEYTFWKEADLDITALKLNEGQQLKWFTEDNIMRMTDQQIAFNFKRIILDFYQKKPWLSAEKGEVTTRK